MKPSALFEALHALIGQRVPLHIWGACGVGKSQIVAQVASDLQLAVSRCARRTTRPGRSAWPAADRGRPGRMGAAQVPADERSGHPLSGRAHLRTADDTGRLLSTGARSQAR